MILNDELNVSLLNDIECVQTFIIVFHFSTFKYNKSVDTNIYQQAHGAYFAVPKSKRSPDKWRPMLKLKNSVSMYVT